VEAVLDRLGIAKAHYLGFSMGGVMGFALARYAPHRLATLIAIGAHPYKRPGRSAYWRNQFSQGMEAYLKGNIADAPQLARTAWYFTRRLANDAEALIALNAGEDQGLEDIITANAIPCLLYIGTKDPNYGGTMRCAKEMPHAQLFELPDMAHGESFRAVDRGLPRVKAFLAANALQ
jgi:pimeloyl-ACP methyl ester carboxylesterase